MVHFGKCKTTEDASVKKLFNVVCYCLCVFQNYLITELLIEQLIMSLELYSEDGILRLSGLTDLGDHAVT